MDFFRFQSKNRPSEYLDYGMSAPEGDEKLPLFIYIHGAGGLGADPTILQYWMVVSELLKRPQHRCRLVIPHCHAKDWIELYDVLLEFTDEMRSRPDIDANRVYLMGESLGAYTVWQLAMSRPEWFAAIVPICGGGVTWSAPRLVNVNVWAFHGALDTTVYPECSVRMVDAINNCGGHAKLTLYDDRDHDCWTPAMTNDATWEWIFSQKRSETEIDS